MVLGTVFVRGSSANSGLNPMQPMALVWVALGRDTSCTPAPASYGRTRPLYSPQRLFGEIVASSNVLTHEPFLERARLQRERERDGAARLALGAYVVARLVDKLLSLDKTAEEAEGFRWQLEAVRRHIGELPADAPETAHLAGVVTAVPIEGPPTSGLWKSLTAYAYFLEHEGRLEESLEILTLAARAQGPATSAADFTAYALFAGRLNRQLARWELASACYGEAEDAASRTGDSLSRLRGRLGQGAVHRGMGNYPAARAIAEDVVREATELQLTEAQAMSYADLGSIYNRLGLRLEALEALYQAFRLSSETPQQMRALGDLAVELAEIGAIRPARIAFQIVVDSTASVLVRANALLELMELESSAGNRVAFERCRAAAEQYKERMSPSMLVDYHYKMGVGLGRFGQATRARTTLTIARDLAEQHKLNAWYFKVEQALGHVADDVGTPMPSREVLALSEAPAVREMELGLQKFAAAAAEQ
jgi:tetratricopeptide (TPR) repeat protein